MSVKYMRVIAASLFFASGVFLCVARPWQAYAQTGGQRGSASGQTDQPRNAGTQQASPQAQSATRIAFKPAEAISAADVRYPFQTPADGIVLFDVSLSARGEIKKATVLQDVPPFTEAAAQSLRDWKFAAASQNGSAEDSEMLVAFVFRHAVKIAPLPPFTPVFPTQEADNEARGAFIAPGILAVQYARYPPSTIAAGAMVVQVSVNADGSTGDVGVVRDMANDFAPLAITAAKGWEFQGALRDGRAVPCKVAIAFVFPSRALDPF